MQLWGFLPFGCGERRSRQKELSPPAAGSCPPSWSWSSWRIWKNENKNPKEEKIFLPFLVLQVHDCPPLRVVERSWPVKHSWYLGIEVQSHNTSDSLLSAHQSDCDDNSDDHEDDVNGDDDDADDDANSDDDDDDAKRPRKNVEVRTRVTACSPWRHPALRRHPCNKNSAFLGPLSHLSLQYSLYNRHPYNICSAAPLQYQLYVAPLQYSIEISTPAIFTLHEHPCNIYSNTPSIFTSKKKNYST